MPGTTVLSVGGSIVAPDGVDPAYVRAFVHAVRSRLESHPDERMAVVIGGGSLARRYQAAFRDIEPGADTPTLDTIGIAATRVNATLVRAAFGELASAPLVLDPTIPPDPASRVIVSGGWKPGFSTDNVAVNLAETLGADTVINLSNIRQIYTADPGTNPDAHPLDEITWDELISIVGDEWIPGANTPFDPVATRKAASLGMTVIAADGRDLENMAAILDGKPFVGTTIRPASHSR